MRRQPVLFVSHGAPTHALDTGPYSASLRRFGDALTGEARPSAIAVVPAVVTPVRGLDHGAWVPLRLALPDASIPVVQVSLPAVPPEALVAFGEALRPLRDEGVLLVASGGLVHNLGDLDFAHPDAAPAPWALDFDRWTWERAALQEREALVRWQRLAPNPARAHPHSDHFDPLLVALGAAWPGERAESIFEGIAYATLSLRTFAFRPAAA